MTNRFVILVLICVILLSGCQSADSSNTNQTTAHNNGVTEYLEMPHFSSVESYQEWFAQRPAFIPSDFIHYETVCAGGTFKHLQINEFDENGVYVDYSYRLIDATGYAYRITINHLKERFESIGDEDIFYDSVTDMRTHPSTSAKIVEHNGITYYYASGTINCIEWETENCVVSVSGMRDYTMSDPNTFLAKLLSTDGADVAEALQMLSLQPVS